MYAYEVRGCEVVAEGRVIGRALDIMSLPGSDLLAVEVEGQEKLVPFRPPVLVRVDRARRRIEIDPPPGLLDL